MMNSEFKDYVEKAIEDGSSYSFMGNPWYWSVLKLSGDSYIAVNKEHEEEIFSVKVKNGIYAWKLIKY